HAQLPAHPRARTAAAPRRAGGPPPGPILHPQPRGRDPWVHCGPRPDRALRVGTAPPVLVPHRPHRPPERRQVSQLHPWPVLDLRRRPTLLTDRSRSTRLDVQPQRGIGAEILDTQDVDVGQADNQLAHANRVTDHRGPPAGRHRTPPDWQDPCYAPTTFGPRSLVHHGRRSAGETVDAPEGSTGSPPTPLAA